MPIKGAVNNQSLRVFPITPMDLSMAHYKCVKVPAQTFSITPIHVYMDQQPDLINLTRSFVKLNMVFKTTRKCQSHIPRLRSSYYAHSSQQHCSHSLQADQ